ncbi:hypothetical protein [Intrasporangium sp.]|jgi:hypothetical protein|uniref:hypothetical protein n=1 Tax=Intrasporangium sp. TaxID=1925024 RepID=UPI003365752E
MSSWPARSERDIFATSADAQAPLPRAVAVGAGDVPGEDGVGGGVVAEPDVEGPPVGLVAVDASG